MVLAKGSGLGRVQIGFMNNTGLRCCKTRDCHSVELVKGLTESSVRMPNLDGFGE